MGLARRARLTPYDDLADDELGWSDSLRAKLAAAADELAAAADKLAAGADKLAEAR
jgi:X-X-X-Leu-X-X-Gly heptad repeat protein